MNGLINEVREQYRSLWKYLGRYSKVYGGLKGVFTSPFTHAAILLTVLVFIVLNIESEKPTFQWYEIPVIVLPTMLGFTLAAYAAHISLGGEGFLKVFGGTYADGKPSPLLRTSAAFFHFIFVQVISLIFALVAKVGQCKAGPIAWVGFFLFSYSIMTGFAAGLRVWQSSWLLDAYVKREEVPKGAAKKEGKNESSVPPNHTGST